MTALVGTGFIGRPIHPLMVDEETAPNQAKAMKNEVATDTTYAIGRG